MAFQCYITEESIEQKQLVVHGIPVMHYKGIQTNVHTFQHNKKEWWNSKFIHTYADKCRSLWISTITADVQSGLPRAPKHFRVRPPTA